MDSVIRFLAEFEAPIYIILGIVAVIFLRRILLAYEEKNKAVFGLEREAARRNIAAAATVLILVGMLTAGEFVVATFLVGELDQAPSYATPTIDKLMTPTATLDPSLIEVPEDATPTPTRYPQAEVEGLDTNCEAGVLEINKPQHNDHAKGVVKFEGTVNTASLGSYQFDFSTMGEPNWQTISAGSGVKIEENIGNWYTSELLPGPYLVRLMALDNQGMESDVCIIIIHVDEND
jgi:hypothetical protein